MDEVIGIMEDTLQREEEKLSHYQHDYAQYRYNKELTLPNAHINALNDDQSSQSKSRNNSKSKENLLEQNNVSVKFMRTGLGPPSELHDKAQSKRKTSPRDRYQK